MLRLGTLALLAMVALPLARSMAAVPKGSFLERHLNESSLRMETALEHVEVSSQLLALGADCRCSFSGKCGCEEAMKFMGCIKSACNSGRCSCDNAGGVADHFVNACGQMETTCPASGILCTPTAATCGQLSVVRAGVAQPLTSSEGQSAGSITIEEHKKTMEAQEARSHQAFGTALIISVSCLAIVFAMANSSNKAIAVNTWASIDYVIVVFLAVSWFYVMNHIFDYFAIKEGVHSTVAHIAFSVGFLVVAIIGAWLFKDPTSRNIWVSVMTIQVLFANTGAIGTAQTHSSGDMLGGLYIVLGAAGLFALLAVILRYFKPEPNFLDEMECSTAGGALAAGVVLWINRLVCGEYHQLGGGNKDGLTPSRGDAMIMFAVGIGFCIMAVVLTPKLTQKVKNADNYWVQRFYSVLTSVIGILPYFSLAMSLAHMALHHFGLESGCIQAVLLSALLNTVIGCLIIVMVAKVRYFSNGSEIAMQLTGLLTGLGGYITGMGWSALLNKAIDEALEGQELGHPFEIKFVVTVGLSAVLLPVYACYFKPIADAKAA